jgi:hypothetical protein
MAIVTINDEHLTNIANAIRDKGGSNTYKPKDMASAILALDTSWEEDVVGNTIDVNNIVSINFKADTIAADAFRNCSMLEEVETNAKTIGDYAFEGCSNLKRVKLTNVETSGNSPFKNCRINKLDLGETIQSFDLDEVTHISDLIIRKGLNDDGTFDMPTITTGPYSMLYNNYGYVYVPRDTLEFYRASNATIWEYFEGFSALENYSGF